MIGKLDGEDEGMEGGGVRRKRRRGVGNQGKRVLIGGRTEKKGLKYGKTLLDTLFDPVKVKIADIDTYPGEKASFRTKKAGEKDRTEKHGQ